MTMQIENLQKSLEWLKTCPFEYTISSMQGGFVHIKLLIPMERTCPVYGKNE